MWSIDYLEWEKIIGQFFNIPKSKLNKSLQTYPFSKLSEEQKNYILSKDFYDSKIKNGQFLNSNEIFYSDNILQKNNGDLRNVTLVSPIIYLVFVLIGGHLSEKINVDSHASISHYAGNFEEGDLSYSKNYKNFTVDVKMFGSFYKFYLKTDFSNFFNSINISMLFKNIEKLFPDENAKTLLIFRRR